MRFQKDFVEATLVRRYKRFLADVELDDGSRRTVHCPNPGRMTSCGEPGSRVLISDSGNPRRKLRLTLEMVRAGRTWIGVNTAVPVDRIAHGLAHQVVADGPALQAVLLQQIPLFAHVAILLQRLAHVKVIAPAGQLQPVEAPLAHLLGQRRQWQIGPLSSK
jgi:hypothetical protein